MKSKSRTTAMVRFVSLFMAVIVLVSGCGNTNADNMNAGNSQQSSETGDVSVDTESGDIVGDGATEDTETEGTEGTEEPTTPPEPELSEEEKFWLTRLTANPDTFLNVRQAASTDSAVVGRLKKGDVAIIVEKGAEWTKIISGKVEGYVFNEFCLFGEEAKTLAKKYATVTATTTATSLNLRTEPSTTSRAMTQLEKGTKIKVKTDADVENGWLAVYYGNGVYYISAEYATLEEILNTGMTTAEVQEQARIEAERKKAEEKALQKAKEQAAIDNASDLELLAALIWCEAGAEPYEAQLAVGACVMNRVKHRHYPNTMRGVIFQKNQFEPYGNGKVARALMSGAPSASCRKAAAAALAGEDNTGGCRSFRLASTGLQGVVYGKIVFISNTP